MTTGGKGNKKLRRLRRRQALRQHTWEMREKTYYVYMLASASGVLYTGVTNNVQVRAMQHRQQRIPGFTKTYHVKRLVYFEMFSDVRAAIGREKQIKRWRRSKKVNLIESQNPKWLDQAAEWFR